MNKTTELTPEFLTFLEKNRSDIESLHKNAFEKFINEARSKADHIDSLADLEQTKFKTGNYNPSGKLKCVKYYGTKFRLQIKLRVIPNKYALEIWAPNSSERKSFQNFIEEKFEKNLQNGTIIKIVKQAV